jgi:excinuclease UvrABC ATPase subunit
MMRKSVVKRAAKYWPSCESLNNAIHVINEHEGLEEVPVYTEETKHLIDMLLGGENAFSFSALIAPMDEEEETALINSFPKGKISSNKEKWRKLCAVGFSEWEGFIPTIKEYIDNSDVNSLRSDLDGFEDYEKRHLCNLLGGAYTAALKGLMSHDASLIDPQKLAHD